MKFTEPQLELYSSPLSQTEENQCIHAIGMVRDALKPLGFTDDGKPITAMYEGTLAYAIEMRSTYGSRRIKLFVQGSYANNTNVRTESDVDIAVIQEETFRTHYRSSTLYPQSDSDYGFVSSPPQQKAFKDEVQECLVAKFGRDVERKNKSIKVHGNTYRKDADAVPCMRYRDYSGDYIKDESNYIGGVVIFPDQGGAIINYPEQHILNGKIKNTSTHYHYKKMVRIMKKMRYLMQECGMPVADNVSSFALESLLWNIPDSHYLKYGQYRKLYHFLNIITYLQSHKSEFGGYKEANGIKPLFPSSIDQTNMGRFIDLLAQFYSYD